MTPKNKHEGQSLEDFLKEEGTYEETMEEALSKLDEMQKKLSLREKIINERIAAFKKNQKKD